MTVTEWTHCPVCGGLVQQHRRDHQRMYCSPRCQRLAGNKQAQARRRRKGQQ